MANFQQSDQNDTHHKKVKDIALTLTKACHEKAHEKKNMKIIKKVSDSQSLNNKPEKIFSRGIF